MRPLILKKKRWVATLKKSSRHMMYISKPDRRVWFTLMIHLTRKWRSYDLLKAEVQRGLKLLQRDRLDFLNVAFMATACNA